MRILFTVIGIFKQGILVKIHRIRMGGAASVEVIFILFEFSQALGSQVVSVEC